MSLLYIIPTPIGNLKDITLRAIDTLKEVDFILAEDTRVAKKLLTHYSINKKVIAFHQHNEHKLLKTTIDSIIGKSVALISDAGTPGISDPGFLLVRACLEANIKVETLTGATAFIPALINSGFPCDKFYFHGFLPHKKGRLNQLEYIKSLNITTILYESPHRLIKTLEQIETIFGKDKEISISREISKIHEETFRGNVFEVKNYFENKQTKGEFVIIIQ